MIKEEFQPREDGQFSVIKSSIDECVYMYVFEKTIGASMAKKGEAYYH